MNWKKLWKRIRLIWITLGILATIIFAGWSLIAYRANPEARAALGSDARVTVTSANAARRHRDASKSCRNACSNYMIEGDFLLLLCEPIEDVRLSPGKICFISSRRGKFDYIPLA